MRRLVAIAAAAAVTVSARGSETGMAYLDYAGRDDVLTGGVKLIPINTPKGTFRVWTKRVGNNPTTKMLLLHGGPGATHEYLEAFDSYFPAAGIEYYYPWVSRGTTFISWVIRGAGSWPSSTRSSMQGPSELGASGELVNWDRTADLGQITVPTLVIGAQHDTMDPKHMEWMAGALGRGRFLLCPNGSHMAMYDGQQTYFTGLIQFVRDVDAGRF